MSAPPDQEPYVIKLDIFVELSNLFLFLCLGITFNQMVLQKSSAAYLYYLTHMWL